MTTLRKKGTRQHPQQPNGVPPTQPSADHTHPWAQRSRRLRPKYLERSSKLIFQNPSSSCIIWHNFILKFFVSTSHFVTSLTRRLSSRKALLHKLFVCLVIVNSNKNLFKRKFSLQITNILQIKKHIQGWFQHRNKIRYFYLIDSSKEVGFQFV